MNLNLFNFLEDEASALADRARASFAIEHPAAAAALGMNSERYATVVDAFIDVLVTGQVDAWDPVAQELLGLNSADPDALVDLPLGLVRTVSDRLVEATQYAAAPAGDVARYLSDAAAAGHKMACHLVKLYQALRAKAARTA